MNILMTGYTGFLGKSLHDILKKEHNIFYIPSKNINRLDQIFIEKNQSTFIHMGWGGASNNKDLNSNIQIENIKQSIDLFNFALHLGVKHFVFVSTSWVYGDYSKVCNENDVCKPKNLYGFSKLKVEEIWKELSIINNVKLTIIRPFWIFGQGDKENRFIPQIIKKFLNNELINLHPSQNTVDYLFINDFISAVNIILKNEQDFQIYNICSAQGYKIKDLVEKIKTLINSKSDIKYNDCYPCEFNMQWIGCNNKLKSLGWRSKTSLEDGLTQIIKNYKKI